MRRRIFFIFDIIELVILRKRNITTVVVFYRKGVKGMPKNGGTSYWGTAGIFVSNNEQESPESRDLYAEVCRNWADQKSLTGLDFIMRKKIESMP